MFGARTTVQALTLLALFAFSGCCCNRKGVILRGDFALELNRVSHLFGRYDDYEMDSGDCDCDACTGAWLDGGGDGGGSALQSPEPRLHPVPTRPVFAPNRGVPTPAVPQTEEAPPPFDEPSSSVPSGRKPQRYGTTTPRGARPLSSPQFVNLELNAADRPTRRRALDPIAKAPQPAARRR